MQYSAVLIKPDALRDNLLGAIIKSLKSYNFKIFGCKICRLSESDICRIYSGFDLKLQDVLAKRFAYKEVGLVMLGIMSGACNIENELAKIKGKSSDLDDSTIRGRFVYFPEHIRKQDLVDFSVGDPKVRRLYMEHVRLSNRIHTPDNLRESMVLLNLYLDTT